MRATASQRSDRRPALEEVPQQKARSAGDERSARGQEAALGYIIPLVAMAIGTIIAILIKYRGLPF